MTGGSAKKPAGKPPDSHSRNLELKYLCLHRPEHKELCAAGLGAGLESLVTKSLVSNPLVIHYLLVCAALLHDLDKITSEEELNARARKPLHARVDIGIEPADIGDLVRLCKDPAQYDHTGVEGMLQFHHFDKPGSIRPDTLVAWKQTRAKLDEVGYPNSPVVVFEFVNDEKQSFCCSLPFYSYTVDAAKEAETFSSQPRRINNLPIRYDIANYLK